MIMSEKCRNNKNLDNPLTFRRTDGGKNSRLGIFSNPVTQNGGKNKLKPSILIYSIYIQWWARSADHKR